MARKKRLPAPPQSQHLEVLYMRDLNKLLAPATLILRALKARERMRMDTMSDQAMLDQIIAWLERAIEPEQVRKLARRQMKRIKKTTDPTFSTWLDIMSGADMSFDPELAITQQRTFADMAASTRIEQNVALVQGVTSTMARELRAEVEQGLLRGERPASIVEIFEKRLKVGKSNLERIARDQTSKAQAELSRIRQEALGVESYEWSTSGDERVRASHKALDGKIFRWDQPPSVGHPGHDVGCRCVSVPIL